jgi:WXG100 family type VII secretion target
VTGFGTETEVMTSVAGRLESINATLQSQLRTLQSQLAPLAGQWQGQGASSFQATMARWDQDSARMNAALRAISERVREGAGRYAVNEQDAAQMLNLLGDQGGATGGGAPGSAPGSAPGGGFGHVL